MIETVGLDKHDVLSLIENIDSLILQALNTKAICESRDIFQEENEEGWREEQKKLKEEQIKLTAERRKCLISNSRSKWSLEAISNRNELFFWTGFPSKTMFQAEILPLLITR